MRTKYLEVDKWTVLQSLLTPVNALVVEIMLATGLRVNDVLSLKTSQIKERFTVSESKTGKKKRVYFRPSLLKRVLYQSGTVWVFPGMRDPVRSHRTRQAVWHDIKRASRAMRLDGVIAPHSARKSVAVDEFRKSKDIEKVRHKLNHDRLETTLLYLLSELPGRGGLGGE